MLTTALLFLLWLGVAAIATFIHYLIRRRGDELRARQDARLRLNIHYMRSGLPLRKWYAKN